MNKNDFINRFAEVSGFTKVNSEHAINTFIKVFREAMINETPVKLANLGTFKPYRTRPSQRKLPGTTDTIETNPTQKISFIPSGGLLEEMENIYQQSYDSIKK